MKPWMKWTATALVLTLLAAGAVRTLAARKDRQAAFEAQQLAQKVPVSMTLSGTDLVQAQTLDLQMTVPVVGPIKSVSTAFLKARVPGELRGLTVREGDSVRQGQVLAHIDPTESDARLRQARQQVAAAKAQVDIAQRSFDNSRALVTQGFISGTALDTSQANLAAAQANLAAAQSGADLAAKALDDTVLRAPISGEIAQRLAQTGERVAVDARVVEIIDNRQLELEASLAAADAMQVKVGQSAQLHLDGVTTPINAKVQRVNPGASAGSRAVVVYLAVAPHPHLRHGLFVQGSLQVGTVRALALPLTAVRTDKPQPYVQAVSQKQIQHINVATGLRADFGGTPMVVVTGIAEGTLVVSGQVGTLRAGTPVQTAPVVAGSQ